MKGSKLFVGIFLGLLLIILSCWLLGQYQQTEPQYEQKVVEVFCPNPITTTITITGTGYGYLDYDNRITVSLMHTMTSQVITICRSIKIFLPIIVR